VKQNLLLFAKQHSYTFVVLAQHRYFKIKISCALKSKTSLLHVHGFGISGTICAACPPYFTIFDFITLIIAV
jgi:hypothetical protein